METASENTTLQKIIVAEGDVKITTAVKKTCLLKNKDSVLQIAESILPAFKTEFLEIAKKVFC